MTAASSIVIRKYGLLDPLDWGPDCHEHLLRQSRLWNRLVAIERRIQERREQSCRTDAEHAVQLARIESERKAWVKKACHESGLWWGNYNAVYRAYERARTRALRTGAQLR